MMTPKEGPGQRVSGCDHLVPEQLPDHAKDLWQGVMHSSSMSLDECHTSAGMHILQELSRYLSKVVLAHRVCHTHGEEQTALVPSSP